MTTKKGKPKIIKSKKSKKWKEWEEEQLRKQKEKFSIN